MHRCVFTLLHTVSSFHLTFSCWNVLLRQMFDIQSFPLRPIFRRCSDFGWAKWDFRDPVLLKFRALFLNTGSQKRVTWIKGVFYNCILNILLLYLTVLEASARQWSLVPQAKWCSIAYEQANTFPKAHCWNHSTQHLRDTHLSGSICSVCPPNTHFSTCGFSSKECVKWY